MGLLDTETKFESSVKQVPYSQEAVYRTLSDLRNLERVRDRIPGDKVQSFTFDADSVSAQAPLIGELTLNVVERDEPKCVKFETAQSPVPFNAWVQVLPVDETTSKLKVTIKAELNPFIKGMVSGPLQTGVEKIAEALANIEYV